MMIFWTLSAAMILVALAMLAPALLRARKTDALDRDQQNLVIARERLDELHKERASGALSEEQFEQAKQELEQALLLDIDGQTEVAPVAGSKGAGRLSMALLVVLVPALTLTLYFELGSPRLMNLPLPGPTVAHTSGGVQGQMPPMNELVEKLIKRLNENPQDTQGWFLLGRSLMQLRDFPRAARTFENLHQLVGDQPAVLLAWADAQAMAQGGAMRGKPTELVLRAIELEPDNAKGLWLAGMAEEQQGNYAQAIAYWERLKPLLGDDVSSRQEINGMIAAARQKGGVPASVAVAETPPEVETAPIAAEKPKAGADQGAAIRVRISLAPALQEQVKPEESLFIYARALQGPKMPLAAARHQVRDLPLELTLDDAGAMMPAMKLSNFEQVVVGARVSRSGGAIAQSGDLRGEISPVPVSGAGLVEVVIDSPVP
jgi:cytochrome c-type biogenesis protein CcmH